MKASNKIMTTFCVPKRCEKNGLYGRNTTDDGNDDDDGDNDDDDIDLMMILMWDVVMVMVMRLFLQAFFYWFRLIRLYTSSSLFEYFSQFKLEVLFYILLNIIIN